MRLRLTSALAVAAWRFLNSLRVSPARNRRRSRFSGPNPRQQGGGKWRSLYHYLLAKGHSHGVAAWWVRPRICGLQERGGRHLRPRLQPPGALRAGFEYYGAFPEDAKANAGFLKQKLSMSVLGSGAASFVDHEHPRYIATDVRAVEIKDSGHWVAEEQPDAVASAPNEFLPPPE